MSSIQENDDKYDGTTEPAEFAAGLLEKMENLKGTIEMYQNILAKYAAASMEAAIWRLELRKTYRRLMKLYDQWQALTTLEEAEIEEHHRDFTEVNYDTF